jgi:hypothetical protein
MSLTFYSAPISTASITEAVLAEQGIDCDRINLDLSTSLVTISGVPIDSPQEQLSRRKRRLIDERNFGGCPSFFLQPNLKILDVSQFKLSSLEEAMPTIRCDRDRC